MKKRLAVFRLISDFGEEIFTVTNSERKSLVHQSITEQKLGCARLLFDFAAERGIAVDLAWLGDDVLGWSVQRGLGNSVKFILDRIAQRCTTPMQSAKIIRMHFPALIKKFPSTVEKYITNDRLCFEYGRFKVPASIFQGKQDAPLAIHCDDDIAWRASSSEELKEFWAKRDKQLGDRLLDTSEPEITAVSKFVCAESPFQTKPSNFVSQLLSAKFRGNAFDTETVKALVQWKWNNSCRKIQIVTSSLHCISILLLFAFLANSGIESEVTVRLQSVADSAFILGSCAAACLAIWPLKLLW